jgi:sec-independent protein translocase protein TatA
MQISNTISLIGGLGTQELVIIGVLAILFFGVGKLPSLAKDLGSSINILKKEVAGVEDSANDIKNSVSEVRTEIDRPVAVQSSQY